MSTFRSTPLAERTDAPYANLTAKDLEQHQGRVIAVDRGGAGIVEVADTVDAVRALMELNHPDQDYRTLPISNLSRLAE